MPLTQLTVRGKCGSCGDNFEATGDDFAVDVVWGQFRGLHDKCKSMPQSELVERIAQRLEEISPKWKGVRGDEAIINVVGHIRHRFGTVEVLPEGHLQEFGCEHGNDETDCAQCEDRRES